MRRIPPSLLSGLVVVLLGTAAAPAASAQSGRPKTIQVVHCDQQEYTPTNWSHLVDFMAEATARNVKVSVEFGTRWAEAVVLDPAKQAEVASWLSAGHAVGAHHHDVTHPYWDGYTDLVGAYGGHPDFQGTMADFKDLMDQMALLVGNPGGVVHFGGLDDSIVYEEPYGMPWGTAGCRAVGCAVSRPYFQVVNAYGVWFVDHAYLGAFDPAQLGALKAAYLGATSSDVFGFTFHVQDYVDDPAQYLDWLDFLYADDPTGAGRFTVPEVLEPMGLPFSGSTNTLSVATGGIVDFEVRTDATLAGHAYQILMNWTGPDPGTMLGGPAYDDLVHVGLNFDSLTVWGRSPASAPYLTGFSGVLDASGGATARLDTLGPLPVGVASRQLLFVVVARDPVTHAISFSSLAWPVDLVP